MSTHSLSSVPLENADQYKDVAQLVECLPSMHRALNPFLRTT